MKRHLVKDLRSVLVATLVSTWCVGQGLPTISSAASASSFGALPTIAPGSWIEIYGSNLAVDTRSWTANDFTSNVFGGLNAPYSLDGTRVYVGGQPACISYISPTQINAQASSSFVLQNGPPEIVVSAPGGTSAPYSINVNGFAAGLLAPPSFNVGGIQYVAALFSDGTTFVLPPGAIPGVPSRRAQPGDTITLYGTGFGSSFACQTSEPSGEFPLPVKFGPALGTNTYSGLAPSAVGLYQFNVVVPPIQSSDTVPLTFTLNGVPGTQTLYTAVQNNNPIPQVSSLTLSSIFTPGGGTLQGTVTLSAVAPPGGAVVALSVTFSSNDNAATVPATITVPAGEASAGFTISTTTVSSIQEIGITASSGGSSAQSWFEIAPPTGTVVISMASDLLLSENGAPSIQAGGGVEIGSISQGGTFNGLTDQGMMFGFQAQFNNATLSGLTMTFSQPAASSVIRFIPSQSSVAITAGSVNLTFSSSDANANGTVAGTFTLTSSALTLTGTIAGTYSLIL